MFKKIRKTLEILSKIFCIKMENEYVNKLRESHLSFLFRGMPYVMQFEGSGKTFIKPGPLPVGTDEQTNDYNQLFTDILINTESQY